MCQATQEALYCTPLPLAPIAGAKMDQGSKFWRSVYAVHISGILQTSRVGREELAPKRSRWLHSSAEAAGDIHLEMAQGSRETSLLRSVGPFTIWHPSGNRASRGQGIAISLTGQIDLGAVRQPRDSMERRRCLEACLILAPATDLWGSNTGPRHPCPANCESKGVKVYGTRVSRFSLRWLETNKHY